MSYHINITKSQSFTFGELLASSFLPVDTCVGASIESDAVVVSYNKFYLQNESSRGVALTVGDTRLLTRLDEAQYILPPIDDESYLAAIKYFSSGEDQPNDSKHFEQQSSKSVAQKTTSENKWWQFWKR